MFSVYNVYNDFAHEPTSELALTGWSLCALMFIYLQIPVQNSYCA
jgi:hypothetical protein